MKRIFCLLLFLVFGNCDRIDFTEEDLKKYPELQPFILSHTDFEGEHDIDLGQITFSYKLKTPLVNTIDVIDSVAFNRDWSIKRLSNLDRLYLKMIKDFPDEQEIDSLFMRYSPDKSQLSFKWK